MQTSDDSRSTKHFSLFKILNLVAYHTRLYTNKTAVEDNKNNIRSQNKTAKLISVFIKLRSDHHRCVELPEK
jgi:hypothetical protein